MKEKNSKVDLIGTFGESISFSHEAYGENFLKTFLNVSRKSDTVDMIPVLVSERLCNLDDYKGRKAHVTGELRTKNTIGEDGKCHLEVFVFPHEVEEADESIEDSNEILLSGYICKDVVYRNTPLGREISDILVAVNREYNKSDYIPCIAWGRNARYAESFDVGKEIKLRGRIQSREYINRAGENKTTYEVSIVTLS